MEQEQDRVDKAQKLHSAIIDAINDAEVGPLELLGVLDIVKMTTLDSLKNNATSKYQKDRERQAGRKLDYVG